ncbi:MAG: hypothetical protein ACPGTI_10865, partial [bacterium]
HFDTASNILTQLDFLTYLHRTTRQFVHPYQQVYSRYLRKQPNCDYPFKELSAPNRLNLYAGRGYGEKVDYPNADTTKDPGRNSKFSYTGGEQDAFAEYMSAFHSNLSEAYSLKEQNIQQDKRVVKLR